jgi:RimJ/RimL family protein N-acetyltransferase
MERDTGGASRIAFRRLTHADLPRLHEWLRREHVDRWWQEGSWPYEKVAAEYGRYIEGADPTEPYLVLLDERPIGYIQAYRTADWPELAAVGTFPPGTAGVDLFIGEADLLYRGLGPRILTAFLREVVFADPEVPMCIIDPAVSNAAAIRAYEKTGYRYLRTVRMPGDSEPSYFMTLSRAEWLRRAAE